MRRALAILCGFSSACALFSDLDGLSSNVVIIEAGPPDADIATDANVASDVQDASDAGCAVTFCDDFDTQALGFDWESSFQGGGTRAFDTENFRSAPRAMVFASEGAVDPTFNARQLKGFNATSSIGIEASVLIDATAAGTRTAFLGFEGVRASDGARYKVYFDFDDDTATGKVYEDVFTQPRVFVQHTALRWAVKGTWTRMKMTLSSASADATFLAVDVDGKEALASTQLTHAMRFTAPIRPWIGMDFVTPPTAGWRVDIDDVAIAVK